MVTYILDFKLIECINSSVLQKCKYMGMVFILKKYKNI